jgi:tRNA threonylcarbamoyladenosine biosynthesis protein TsaE
MIECISASAEETFTLGKKIALQLTAGSVVALKGELGSGKTCLAKGIADGLGIKENILSPTYTIINEYKSGYNCCLFHIDAYRLDNEEDFEALGGSEIISGNGIFIIEWSNRIEKSIPKNAIYITIEITDGNTRKIKIEGMDSL